MSNLLSQGAGAVLALGGFAFLLLAALGGWAERTISTPWRTAFAIFGVLLIVFMLFIVYSVVIPPTQDSNGLSNYVLVLIVGILFLLFAALDWLKLSITPALFQGAVALAGLFLVMESSSVLFPSSASSSMTTSQVVRLVIEDYFHYIDRQDYDRAWDLVKDSQWVASDYNGERAKWQAYFLSHNWAYEPDFYHTIVPYADNKASAIVSITVRNRATFETEASYSAAMLCLRYEAGAKEWLINRINLDGKGCEIPDK